MLAIKEAKKEESDVSHSSNLTDSDASEDDKNSVSSKETSKHSFKGGGLIRDKTLRIKLIKKAPTTEIMIDRKNTKLPEKTGDGLTDYVQEFAFSLGIDPNIFTSKQVEEMSRRSGIE